MADVLPQLRLRESPQVALVSDAQYFGIYNVVFANKLTLVAYAPG